MNLFIKAIFVCVMIYGQNVFAVEVSRLYETEVMASSELESDRILAIKQALKDVLSRIVAAEDLLQDTTVKAILDNAQDFVDEYQYSLASAGTQGNEHKRLMRVLFNEKLIVNTLRPARVGLWNEIRPRTLVWLVVEKQGKQQFFDESLMPVVSLALEKASRNKKLPILFPIQDLTEKRVLSISDVLSAYSEHLLEVSTRYEVVSTLAGKLVNEGHCWKAEWTFYFDGKIEQWLSPCEAINASVLTGFQGVYDRLSKYYAVKPKITSVDSVILNISNLKKFTDRERVLSYLESLSMVKTATWLSEKAGNHTYRLFYQGDLHNLKNILNKSHMLQADGMFLSVDDEWRYKFLLD